MNNTSAESRWQFWIDVGGTFTDCIALSPDKHRLTCKVLSSGVVKGRIDGIDGNALIRDASRINEPSGIWQDYRLRILDEEGAVLWETTVAAFDADRRTLTLSAPLPDGNWRGRTYELSAGEEAPILAIRKVLELRVAQTVPAVDVRLGTTRGTNALLTRNGAKTAFVTTRGFRDVLLIGNQDRPRLFDLNIIKPEPLFERVVEIDERLAADGRVLKSPDADAVRRDLLSLKQTGVESLAICLLHSFANDAHELLVERIARDVGFEEISVSCRLSPLIKIVSRGDTTVMDAYLNPILRAYVARLRSSLPGSKLRIMTSAGGLIDADHFVGKDSILSGPAGGVIGFSKVAQQAGFDRSIGFDMGGTSTDVSRFDGQYEREFETKKAGVRIVSPMLAIETVAAGGGSICDFDGVKLVVGPQSAGADPGPACYGRGGPLTVTDVNLFLGKILPGRFPFPLNVDAVEHRLQELADRIAAAPMGKRYSPHELAEGYTKIANANMVRPIRNISVAKGYDPADYVLVSFGGAGSQHACAIARALDIHQVLIHPDAGILSAYGIGQADVRRFREKNVLRPYSTAEVERLEVLFATLAEQAHAEVLAEGVPAAQILPPLRWLEMRYQGTESSLLVPCPTDGDYAAEFARLHRQHYGYLHTARDLEITTARVEVIGEVEDQPLPRQQVVENVPAPCEQTTTWFGGEPLPTNVYLRADLQPGDHFQGPAIVCEETSTIVVDPGFNVQVTEQANLLLTDLGKSGREDVSAQVDPVMLEIFNNLFASIAEQMGTTLQRTSVSTNVKERLDFSCAVFSATGDLVVNAPHIPVHLGAMSETVKRIIDDNPHMQPGDVFVTNDPYRGGSHLPDVTVVTPVHHQDDGSLLFFTASRAHHAEIGGIVPGSMPPFSRNLGQEGVLIRNFQLIDAGNSRESELKHLLLSGPYPSRNVADNLADVAAQVAANNTGVTQLHALVRRYSLPVVAAYMQHIQRAASTKMRLALSRQPDGQTTFTDHLDDGSPITVTLTISGETATVDFTGTGPVLSSNLNANRAIVTAAVLYVFRCLIDEDIPLNSGVMEPIRIVLPDCLLNPPEHENPAECAAVVGGNVETSQRVVDVLLGALGIAAASQGTMNNFTFGNETFGYYETICGGSGATVDADGADAVHTHMTNTRLTDPEVIERRYPVRIHEFSIRAQSGGLGAHHGGNGIVRRIEFVAPLQVSLLCERRGEYAPFGLCGGFAGVAGRNHLARAGESESRELDGKVELSVGDGDMLTIETPGGGGFGKPTSSSN